MRSLAISTKITLNIKYLEVAEFMVSRLLSQDSDIAFEDMSDWDDDDWL